MRATRIGVDQFYQLSRKRSKLQKNVNKQNCLVLCEEHQGFRRSIDGGAPCISYKKQVNFSTVIKAMKMVTDNVGIIIHDKEIIAR